MKMMTPSTRPAAKPGAGMLTLQQTLPAAPPAALQRAHTFGTLMSQSVARSAGNGAATAALLPMATRIDTWAELMAMQGAVAERYQQLQQGWLQGWNIWMQECADLKRANTLSEYVEQQFNLTAQFGALLKNQAADVLNLRENIEVDYGYWVAQKVRGQQGGS